MFLLLPTHVRAGIRIYAVIYFFQEINTIFSKMCDSKVLFSFYLIFKNLLKKLKIILNKKFIKILYKAIDVEVGFAFILKIAY